MKRLVAAFSLLLLVGSGCPLSSPPPEAPSENLSLEIGGAWELKSYAAPGEDLRDASSVGGTLAIDADGRLSARICNSMSGAYDIEAGSLKVEALMSTKMFCAGLPGEIEAAFSQGLSSGMAIQHDGDALTLHSDAGATFSLARPMEGGRVGAPTDEEPGEDRAYAGIVTSVNLEQIPVDGPAVVTLRTDDGAFATVIVPSFGLGLCKAKASIADVYALKVGESVEARGSLGADGAIVPCQSEAHYLRVVAK